MPINTDVERIAAMVKNTLDEGLRGERVSTVSVVVGAITGTIYSLTQQGVNVDDIITIYHQHSLILTEETTRKKYGDKHA